MNKRNLHSKRALRTVLFVLLLSVVGMTKMYADNITFADANVKSLCVANWDTNGDGELSYAEAAAVTDLGQVFHYKSSISTFNELQYFTGLTFIGYEAFYYCNGLTSIEIPNSVTSIGRDAFSYCSSLTTIEIPDSMISIGSWAFSYCSSLTTVEIPNTVTSIGNHAFYNCSGLTTIEIPNSVTSMSGNVFYKCSGLEQIIVASGNTVYDSRDNCNAIIETSTNELVTGCKNTVIPNTVTFIGKDAFFWCSGLTTIEIPNSVTSIGSEAFYGCSGLTSMTVLADNPPTLGSNAFNSVNKFIPVYVPCGSMEAYQNVLGWYEFNNYMPATPCDSGEITATAYPVEGGTVTGEGYYDGGVICTISALANPGYSFINWTKDGLGVSNSETYSFYVAGDASFTANFVQEGTIITFADANVKALCVANWDTNDDGELSYAEAAAVTNLGTVFSYKSNITNFDELQYFVGLTSIEYQAFNYCLNLTSIEIPNSVTSIGNYAFYQCKGLTSIEIPNSVTSIGDYAFAYCSGLTTIEIPNSVTSIGNSTFRSCTGLTTIEIPNSVTFIGKDAFFWCSGLTTIEIPNSVTFIGEYAFSNCSGLTSIEIPNSVSLIGIGVFQNCSNLEQIIVASGNTTYDSRDNCNAIIETSTNKLVIGCKNTVIPNSVTTIGNSTFRNCTDLTSIEIPNTVTSIGSSAFSGCSGLTSIDIPNTVTSIGSSAFSSCSGLATVEIPNSVTTIEEDVFYSCSSLTSIEIPNTVTSIGSAAFYNCNGLKSLIVLSSNPPVIGDDAFYGVYKGIPVYVPCEIEEEYTTAHWGSFSNFVGLCAGEITVTANPAEGGTVTGGGYYENGTTFTITATAAPGYSFINWTKDGLGVPYPETYSFYVTGDASYVATFAQGTNITFADANVKALCVANWDTNGDGELSYAEAAAVTDLGTVFKNNSNINSFDELQYFVGLTSIGSAFYRCSGLTSIEIPNSVTSIGGSAFYYCSGLTSIEIPNSVTSIGNYAFYYCSGLASIEIPNSVTSIGGSAFYYCSGLTSIEIPNSLTSIGSSTFSNCSGLTSIEIPNSVTSIGEWAFNNCNVLTSVIVLADNPPTISNNAFSPANLGIPVYVPCGKVEAYTTIHWGGFSNFVGLCAGEITVMSNPVEGGTVMGGGYYEIGTTFTLTATANLGYSFINWTKDGVGISNSETYSFYVAGDDSYVANFVQGTNITFADANVKNICVANWDTDGDGELSYAEAAAVTDLGTAFRDNSNITNFDELQYFVGLRSIGSITFRNCSGLTSIEIPNSVIYIGSSAFVHCSGLTSIEIPNSVTSIGSSTFSGCSGLTFIELPNSVTFIGGSAFEDCSSLTSIEIPNSVLSIGSSAFSGCSGLISIEIPNSVTSIGNSAFSGCIGLEQIIVDSENTVYDSRDNCNAIIETSTNVLVSGCKHTVIPNTVTSIGEKAFYFCSGLTSIEIPNSVTSIGYVAFCGCSGLTSIEIPNSVTFIGISAFSSCSGLASIVISNSAVIEYLAFSDCSGLTSITIHAETPPAIYSSTFNNCPKSIPVYVPCGCVAIYKSASYWNQFTNIQEVCTQTQTITLPTGWSWWSSYIEFSDIDGLSLLENAIGIPRVKIESKDGDYVRSKVRNGRTVWVGALTSINNEEMYKINTKETCTATIEGQVADPANHPITINRGWNWIGFPCDHSVSVSEAMSGFSPKKNDMIKGKSGSATYSNGTWSGTLNTLEPGKGYMYGSRSNATKTLVFQTCSRGEATLANITPENNYYQPAEDYADNMTVIAVVELDGEELRSDDYELAAFVGDECRGSVKLMYVESINRYVAFLTVFGDEAEDLHFVLTDGATSDLSADYMTYATDGIEGTLDEPVVLRFGATDINENTSVNVNIFPNPSNGVFNIEGKGIRKVSVIDAFGQVVLSKEVSNDAMQIDLSGRAAGIYMLQIVTDNGISVRKLIKK